MHIKDIEGYEGLYGVTQSGLVWSYPKSWVLGGGRICFHRGRFLTQYNHTGGYTQVSLTKDKKTRMHFVHRLVAKAYVHNPDNKLEVNHKDCDKKNNHYLNLEWSTRQENAIHAKLNNLYKHEPCRGQKHPCTHLTDKDVMTIRRLCHMGEKQAKLCKQYKIAKSTMSSIIQGHSWTHLKIYKSRSKLTTLA